MNPFPSPTGIIPISISFAAGIALSEFLALPAFTFLVTGFIFAVFILLLWKKDNRTSYLLLLPFFLSIGTYHGTATSIPPEGPHQLHNLPEQHTEATLRGILLTSPSIQNNKTSLLFKIDAILFPITSIDGKEEEENNIGQDELTPPAFIKLSGRIQLSMKGLPPENIFPGDHLLIRVSLSKPSRFGTPGSFDYPRFLARKSISATGWIRSPLHIAQITHTNKSPFIHSLQYWPEKIRYRINQFIRERLPQRTGSLYSAILTGDKSAVPADILENFKATGTMHLLAISGLHMGLLALCVTFTCSWITRRSQWLLLNTQAWKLAALLSMPILIFYALIAGFQVPVVRSLIMTCVFLLAVIYDRQWNIPTNIAIAAFIILAIHPLSLFTASFQLSFAAVLGLAVIMPRIQDIILPHSGTRPKETIPSRIRRWIFAGLLVSTVATIATLPLALFYFHRFSPISPLSTLLIEPLLCLWSLLIGLISCPFIFFAPDTAGILLHIGSAGLYGAAYLTSILAKLPFSFFWFSTPSIIEVVLYYVFLGSILFLNRHSLFKVIAFSCITALIAVPAYARYRVSNKNFDTVTFLDVGHGNSTIVEFSNGDIAVIDGGGPGSEKFNVGEMIIAPYLWQKRIKKIHTIIVSHSDADHYNGIPFLLKNFKPEILWINDTHGKERGLGDLLKLAGDNGVEIRVPQRGEVLLENNDKRIINLADLHLSEGPGKDNDKSLVIQITSDTAHFLLTGDIEKTAEEYLTKDKNTLATDVLLAPHHGSATSSSLNFIQAATPKHTIISAGKFKPKTFPAPEVLERYEQFGSNIFNTARDGTVTFIMKDGGLEVSTFNSMKE
ncbi:MAG: DNA internalization-related competence protein ComEC/Rec2 [Desulfobulbaceae bacterium]|uniref:DNA internalization-related competence protein ComEC/Rec2 n=1 Tax=Candidatus Desulfobia pelagia TaxID=2841692 RepID=A0A8J6TCV7_9BACT|nr:DNA internalization-related competence protein ComEC/Rec2 [Candidatus Desulfobia pelagia]